MAAKQDSESTDVKEELSKQVSLASDLLAEQRWARGGEALSVIRVNDKVIEEKERELIECIAQNYSRIKGVERELAGLQLQLKLTSGPKKSALELLRRKIELQNEKVVLARGNYHAARKVAETAEEALKSEEGAKDQLCQELNLLVQQSAHAQLERLEQLTQRMELLNKGFTPALDTDLASALAGVAQATDKPAAAPQQATAAGDSSQEAARPSSPGGEPAATASGHAQPSPTEHQTQRPPPARPKGSLERPRRPEVSRADEERATAARARHVPLTSPSRGPPAAKPATPQRPRAPQQQPFGGFD